MPCQGYISKEQVEEAKKYPLHQEPEPPKESPLEHYEKQKQKVIMAVVLICTIGGILLMVWGFGYATCWNWCIPGAKMANVCGNNHVYSCPNGRTLYPQWHTDRLYYSDNGTLCPEINKPC